MTRNASGYFIIINDIKFSHNLINDNYYDLDGDDRNDESARIQPHLESKSISFGTTISIDA